MTSSVGGQRGDGLGSILSRNPVVAQLGEAAREYAKARAAETARKVGEKLTGVTGSLNDTAEGGGFKATAAGETVKRVVGGENPVKATVAGVGAGLKEKAQEVFGRKKDGSGSNKKFMNIVEDIKIGVPVRVAYDQWTQYQDFSTFMKGVDSVEQLDEVNSNWRVKVFVSRRNWKGIVIDQIPDRKISWMTEGAKGTTKGVVTFHPLADDLTQVLVVMEYYPVGPVEKTGNLWRAPGRRARLDIKHFRRFVMMRGEATGAWRGEIRDSQVVRTHEEVEAEEGRPPEELEEARRAGDGRAPRGAEEEPEEEPAAEEEPEEEPEEEEPEEEPEEAPARRPSRRRQPARTR